MRQELLKKYINKEKLGLEVGPLFWGLCRKDEGYNILIWDVSSKEELLNHYKKESKTAKKELEEVDIVSSESIKKAISDYSRKKDSIIKNVPECLDYIISSHNIEHMPNPIQFFIDVSEILKEGGIFNMAIPISTRCFDCFRPLSTTGEMLDAYFAKNKKPSLGDYFDHSFSRMKIIDNNKTIDLNDMTYDFNKLTLCKENFGELTYSAYLELFKKYHKTPYVDNHIWQFNLESFISIFNDLSTCKIIKNLEIINTEIIGIEFIISFRKNSYKKYNLISNEDRLNLKKESIRSYLSDLFKENKKVDTSEESENIKIDTSEESENIKVDTSKESFEINNEKSHIKHFKKKLIDSFYFFSRKILRITLSENKYQSVKTIYQKIKTSFTKIG